MHRIHSKVWVGAKARRPNNLPAIADFEGVAESITGKRWQLLEYAVRMPNHRLSVEDLRSDAGWIVGAVLGDSSDLAAIVHAGGRTRSCPKRGKRAHHAISPSVPETECSR